MTDATARASSHPGRWKRKMITDSSVLLTQNNRELPASSLENGSVINDTTYILFMLIYFMSQLHRETEKETIPQASTRQGFQEMNVVTYKATPASDGLRFTCQAWHMIVITISFLAPTILYHIFISPLFLNFSSRCVCLWNTLSCSILWLGPTGCYDFKKLKCYPQCLLFAFLNGF